MTTSEDLLFKRALQDNNLSALKKIAKADVHNHGLLGMRAPALNKILGTPPFLPPVKLAGINGFDEYITGIMINHLTGAEQLALLLEETVKEAIADGVTILEASIDSSCLVYVDSHADCFDEIKAIRGKYLDIIDFRPELGISKKLPAHRLEEVFVSCIDSGVFKSVDLYGDESLVDFTRFKEFYLYAKQQGVKLKAHIGEFCSPEIVKQFLATIPVDEIQHGISIATDDYLIDLVKESGVRLNICPTSNIILGAVGDLQSHPIKKLYNAGVRLSVNTDDLLVFNQSVSEEFLNLYRHNVLGADELNEIRKMGLV